MKPGKKFNLFRMLGMIKVMNTEEGATYRCVRFKITRWHPFNWAIAIYLVVSNMFGCAIETFKLLKSEIGEIRMSSFKKEAQNE